MRAASTCLVDFHHALPLTRAWGAGRLSSSDGQRFAVRGKGPGVAPLPRYFGHRRHGIQHLTWTSDQYSQYATKAVAATVRDATYVLDGILDNETQLPIEEHATDTHGYTELVFALFDLLGLRFTPRIRDLDEQRLYHHGPLAPSASDAGALLRHRLRPELIEAHWDDLLRLAASLRHGWASASLVIGRLHASAGRNPLARALQEYGRLVKTNFILAWRADEQLERQVTRQLNKSEALQSLRRYLFFAREGQPRHRHLDEHGDQALCLTLVVNAVVVWNTVYIQAALDQLAAEGHAISNSDLAHFSPLQHAHINPYGRYSFDLARRPAGLRPLRPPSAPAPTPIRTATNA